MTYEDHWSNFHVSEEELRPLLEAIGRAVVERVRAHGLTAVVVFYDDVEGQIHVTSYFKEYPQSLEENEAIWQHFSDLTGEFFDRAAVYFHIDEADGADECTDAGYADHMLTLKAA